jgi:hypothetical protein
MGGAGAKEIRHRRAIDGRRRGPRHEIQRLIRWAAQGPDARNKTQRHNTWAAQGPET